MPGSMPGDTQDSGAEAVMSREVWATYAVNDHCVPRAFTADVMLYDRLVIPVPPDNPTEDDKKLWSKFDVGRQERMLKILGDRARTVKWDTRQRQEWKARYEAGKDLAGNTAAFAFEASRTQLTIGLPAEVTAVEAVSSYRSYNDIMTALEIREGENKGRLGPGAVTAVLGREFLVIDEPKLSDERALEEAVALSGDSHYRQKRANYWRWQKEFLNYEVFTSEKALKEAVDEMRELIHEQSAAIKQDKIRLVAKYAFLVGSITLGMFSGSMIPIAISPLALTLDKTFLSIGQFVADRVLENHGENDKKAAAVFCDFDRHFGWH
jgi:hypothetical protein